MKFPAMKRHATPLWALCVLCGLALPCSALDREAFSITSYDLKLTVDTEQHRLGVRGKITLRNASATPQKNAVLQISSSLDWRSITLTGAGGTPGKPVQFLTQPFTSDIDHTGSLSEAIVTLPQPVAPKATVELEIGYEGVVLPDATRLTRLGTPENMAQSSDWDRISPSFTGLRGAGNVAWYPIATEAASLSEGDLFDVLGRWKAREVGSKMHIEIELTRMAREGLPDILFAGQVCPVGFDGEGMMQRGAGTCPDHSLGLDAPSLIIANYQIRDDHDIEIHYLSGDEAPAGLYADEAHKAAPLIADWLGAPGRKAATADLPDPEAPPFESGPLLLTPLASTDAKVAGLTAAHQLAHAAIASARPWINEGLAHFMQALYLEHQQGRQAALDYMGLHRSAFSELEKTAPTLHGEESGSRALANTTIEELYRSKAMYVWWMLRDMVGDAALKKALKSYRPEDDHAPEYMPGLITAQSQRDLQWFFDDWVYHDRGLPDFKIDSVFPSRTTSGSYLVTITIINSGAAGAEVPVFVRTAGPDDITRRVEVRAGGKATFRVELASAPREVVVNDGSVPEGDMTNNVFNLETTPKP
jgi:hypothetical protein